MSILQEDSDSLIEDARLLADAIVVPTSGRNQEFWEAEARSLITTLILYVLSKYGSKDKDQNRWLIFHDIIAGSKKAWRRFYYRQLNLILVGKLPLRLVQGDFLRRPESEKSGVLSTLRQHTDIFDSPSLLKSLASSSLQFAEAKNE